jgi:hypothetical protein
MNVNDIEIALICFGAFIVGMEVKWGEFIELF